MIRIFGLFVSVEVTTVACVRCSVLYLSTANEHSSEVTFLPEVSVHVLNAE